MLCGLCSKLESNGCDALLMHVPELPGWWGAHKKLDAERKQQEYQEQLRRLEAAKQEVVDKQKEVDRLAKNLKN